jgi:hypothetical protein
VLRGVAFAHGRHREQVALASFITGSLLAGGNAVGVRFSNRELAPLWGAGLRFWPRQRRSRSELNADVGGVAYHCALAAVS